MKLQQVVDNVAKQVISKRFVPENQLGLICRYTFRTKDIVACTNIQDMLDEKINVMCWGKDVPRKIHVTIRDFYFRESCEWWCSNIVLCCAPLAACTIFDAISNIVVGPYYEIEVFTGHGNPLNFVNIPGVWLYTS